MKIITVLLSLLAPPVFAQSYTEAGERETLAACLAGAVEVSEAECLLWLRGDHAVYLEDYLPAE